MDEIARSESAGRQILPGTVGHAPPHGSGGIVSARAAILDRLRKAERAGHVPAGQPQAGRSPAREATERLIERFVRELGALGVNAFVEQSEADVRARVSTIVGTRSVMR